MTLNELIERLTEIRNDTRLSQLDPPAIHQLDPPVIHRKGPSKVSRIDLSNLNGKTRVCIY